MKIDVIRNVAAACALGTLFAGCPQQGDEYRKLGEKDDVTNTAPVDHHHHEHGPHDGHIVELGKYHGEIVVDGARNVTLYILGDDAKTAVPVANAIVLLKAASGGEVTEIVLVALPQEGEAEGHSSRFTAAAEAIPAAIKDIEDLVGEIELKVGEEISSAKITHDHDHDHDH